MKANNKEHANDPKEGTSPCQEMGLVTEKASSSNDSPSRLLEGLDTSEIVEEPMTIMEEKQALLACGLYEKNVHKLESTSHPHETSGILATNMQDIKVAYEDAQISTMWALSGLQDAALSPVSYVASREEAGPSSSAILEDTKTRKETRNTLEGEQNHIDGVFLDSKPSTMHRSCMSRDSSSKVDGVRTGPSNVLKATRMDDLVVSQNVTSLSLSYDASQGEIDSRPSGFKNGQGARASLGNEQHLISSGHLDENNDQGSPPIPHPRANRTSLHLFTNNHTLADVDDEAVRRDYLLKDNVRAFQSLVPGDTSHQERNSRRILNRIKYEIGDEDQMEFSPGSIEREDLEQDQSSYQMRIATGVFDFVLIIAMLLLLLLHDPRSHKEGTPKLDITATPSQQISVKTSLQPTISGQPTLQQSIVPSKCKNTLNDSLTAGDTLFDFLANLTDSALLRDARTPQHSAYAWLQDDELFLDPCSNDNLEQRYSMAVLFFSTNGFFWLNNQGWLSPKPECEWFGVDCNLFSQLVELQLNHNNLHGTLPVEISSFTNLANLDLQANQITGPLPTEFGNLVSLYNLSLNANHITGSLPTEIGNMDNLRHLNLHENQITGKVPYIVCANVDQLTADCGGNTPAVTCTCCQCFNYSNSNSPTLEPIQLIAQNSMPTIDISHAPSFYPAPSPVSTIPISPVPSESSTPALEGGQCLKFPHGLAAGDIETTPNDDGRGVEFQLKQAISFHGTNFSTAYQNTDGCITFQAPLNNDAVLGQAKSLFPNPVLPALVAPFLADMSLVGGGQLFARSIISNIFAHPTTNRTDLDTANEIIRAEEGGDGFSGTAAFISTWYNVASFSGEGRNTFQSALVYNYNATWIIFSYGNLEFFTFSDGSTATVGWNADNGISGATVASTVEQLEELSCLTLVFRVSETELLT